MIHQSTEVTGQTAAPKAGEAGRESQLTRTEAQGQKPSCEPGAGKPKQQLTDCWRLSMGKSEG